MLSPGGLPRATTTGSPLASAAARRRASSSIPTQTLWAASSARISSAVMGGRPFSSTPSTTARLVWEMLGRLYLTPGSYWTCTAAWSLSGLIFTLICLFPGRLRASILTWAAAVTTVGSSIFSPSTQMSTPWPGAMVGKLPIPWGGTTITCPWIRAMVPSRSSTGFSVISTSPLSPAPLVSLQFLSPEKYGFVLEAIIRLGEPTLPSRPRERQVPQSCIIRGNLAIIGGQESRRPTAFPLRPMVLRHHLSVVLPLSGAVFLLFFQV